MQYRPIIGIPTQSLHAIQNIPAGLPESWLMSQRYFHAATAAGGVPWMIPLLEEDTDTLRQIFERLDGLFLAGGVDMDPEVCGVERHPLCGVTDPARDRVELQLTHWALEDGMPLLGVCRGLQVLNVAAGGSLYQDLAALHPRAIKHDYYPSDFPRDHLAHDTTVVPGTRLAAIYRARRVTVNSMHHQGIERLGEGLVASAHAPDGLIEGIEGINGAFLVAVQWHPEALTDRDPPTRRLFEAFIDASRDWRQSRVGADVLG